MGGYSKAPFDGFNLALHVKDNVEDVLKNRALLASYVGVDPSSFVYANQVHKLTPIRVDAKMKGRGTTTMDTALPFCDAMYTNQTELALAIFVADCLPILIYDPKNQAVALVHAGWRGVIGELPRITLTHMNGDYGTRGEDCYVYIGPSIGPSSFEVSSDLSEQFSAAYGTDVVSYIKREGAQEKTPHVNLPLCVIRSLSTVGVKRNHITVSPSDTLTNKDFFSYRRESGQTGRIAIFAKLME